MASPTFLWNQVAIVPHPCSTHVCQKLFCFFVCYTHIVARAMHLLANGDNYEQMTINEELEIVKKSLGDETLCTL